MNLTDAELFDFALAIIICLALITLLMIFIFKPLNEAAEPLQKAQSESGQINEPIKETAQVIKDASKAKKRLSLWDSFALVPLYSGLLIVTSFLLGAKTSAWAPMMAKVLIVVTIIAVASDWIENYYSYFAIDGKTEDSRLLPWATHIKWLAIFTATIIASSIFLRFDKWGIAGALLLAASIAGIWLITVLGFDSNKIENSKAIPGAFGFQLLTLLVVGFLLLFERCRASFLDAS